MATKTICDKCKKIQEQNTKKDGWVNLSLNIHCSITEKKFGLESSYNSWDLCPKCAENIAPKILKVLKK